MEPDHLRLSVAQQCELLGLPRSTWYYRGVGESAENLALMRLLDKGYLKWPFYGSRKWTEWLVSQGHAVNRKRMQRLMRLMGWAAICPRRRTTQPAPGHKIYPYLLRNLAIERTNQVWAADITYVPLSQGFMYLSRFCVEALEAALSRGRPEIFNTDQGSQFTSEAFTSVLQQQQVAISMDGRGRWLDNVFIERLWRSVKYENVYLYDYQNVPELHCGLSDYFAFYNEVRVHQALGYRTPAAVYAEGAACR